MGRTHTCTYDLHPHPALRRLNTVIERAFGDIETRVNAEAQRLKNTNARVRHAPSHAHTHTRTYTNAHARAHACAHRVRFELFGLSTGFSCPGYLQREGARK